MFTKYRLEMDSMETKKSIITFLAYTLTAHFYK